MTMHDARWTLEVAESGDVRLRDQKTGEAHWYGGSASLFHALGKLADWREMVTVGDPYVRTDRIPSLTGAEEINAVRKPTSAEVPNLRIEMMASLELARQLQDWSKSVQVRVRRVMFGTGWEMEMRDPIAEAGPEHPTCIETTSIQDAAAGKRTWTHGPECPRLCSWPNGECLMENGPMPDNRHDGVDGDWRRMFTRHGLISGKECDPEKTCPLVANCRPGPCRLQHKSDDGASCPTCGFTRNVAAAMVDEGAMPCIDRWHRNADDGTAAVVGFINQTDAESRATIAAFQCPNARYPEHGVNSACVLCGHPGKDA